MKKIAKYLCMLLCLAMLFALAGCGKQEPPLSTAYDKYMAQIKAIGATGANGTLTVAISPDFAPMDFYDVAKSGDDAIVGFDVLLANYIAQKLDMTLVLKPMSFDACMAIRAPRSSRSSLRRPSKIWTSTSARPTSISGRRWKR